MKILYVISEPLDTKSSTTSFKNVILQELLNNHHEVTLVEYSKETFKSFERIQKKDLNIITGSKYFYLIDSLISKLDTKCNILLKVKKNEWEKVYPEGFIKKITNKLFGHYDLILSVSHPVYSHRIVYDLVTNGSISYDNWNQVWFETWFDYFNKSSKSAGLKLDEKKLIGKADNIFYSSDLLLEDHKKLYPDYKGKMDSFDLPAYPQEIEFNKKNKFLIGYYGSYNSKVRNITPLYNALKKINDNSIIIGDSDLNLIETTNIKIIKKRLKEQEVFLYEQETSILVVLSNWFADIIPGKIYKYASWDKPMLIILDGSERLKEHLIRKFSRYNKIYFSENTPHDISQQIKNISVDLKMKKFLPIKEFSPPEIVNKLLTKGGKS